MAIARAARRRASDLHWAFARSRTAAAHADHLRYGALRALP